MKKRIVALLSVVVLILGVHYAAAEVPDVSNLPLEELIQLQGSINELIAEKATYTLLPGIYDCKNDFKWNWYICKVKSGNNNEEKTATITFHTHGPSNPSFLTYEISSNDDGIKISFIQSETSYPIFMVVQGATLEAVPYSGF